MNTVQKLHLIHPKSEFFPAWNLTSRLLSQLALAVLRLSCFLVTVVNTCPNNGTWTLDASIVGTTWMSLLQFSSCWPHGERRYSTLLYPRVHDTEHAIGAAMEAWREARPRITATVVKCILNNNCSSTSKHRQIYNAVGYIVEVTPHIAN